MASTYKGYEFTRTAAGVEVRDPRWPAKPVYTATDVAAAKRFVSAFREGRTWAAMAARDQCNDLSERVSA